MNKERIQRNDKLIQQVQQLVQVYDSIVMTRPGQQAPSQYEANDVREAMGRLVKEIKTEVLADGEIPA